MSQPVTVPMDQASRRRLSRIGAVSLLASAFLFIAYSITTFYVGSNPHATDIGVFGYLASLDWAGTNFNALSFALIAETLAIALFLPALLALYVRLSEKDAAFTLIGSVLVGTGILIFLATGSESFYYLSEAYAYNQCGDCRPLAISTSSSTFSVVFADEMSLLFIVIGVSLLGWVMVKESASGSFRERFTGMLGITFGASGFVGAIILTSNADPYARFWFVPSILIPFAVWEVLVALRLYRT